MSFMLILLDFDFNFVSDQARKNEKREKQKCARDLKITGNITLCSLLPE